MRVHLGATATGSRSSGCLPTRPNSIRSFLWANLKGWSAGQLHGDSIAKITDEAYHGSQQVCDSDSLVVGFWPIPASASTMTHHQAKGSRKQARFAEIECLRTLESLERGKSSR